MFCHIIFCGSQLFFLFLSVSLILRHTQPPLQPSFTLTFKMPPRIILFILLLKTYITVCSLHISLRPLPLQGLNLLIHKILKLWIALQLNIRPFLAHFCKLCHLSTISFCIMSSLFDGLLPFYSRLPEQVDVSD